MRGEARKQRTRPRTAKAARGHSGRRLQRLAPKSCEQPRMSRHVRWGEDIVDERLPTVHERRKETGVPRPVFAQIGAGLADRSRNHDGVTAIEGMGQRERRVRPVSTERLQRQLTEEWRRSAERVY